AVDRRFDQLAIVGLFHIVRPQPLEHVAEQAELAIGVGVGRLCTRPIEHEARLGCDQRHGYAARRTEENQGSFAHDHPRTWPSFAAHHGPGRSVRLTVAFTGLGPSSPLAGIGGMSESPAGYSKRGDYP